MSVALLFIGAVTMWAAGIILKNESTVSGGLVLMWIGLAVLNGNP